MAGQAARLTSRAIARTATESAQNILADSLVMARALADSCSESGRLLTARGFVAEAVDAYWQARQNADAWPVAPLPKLEIEPVSGSAAALAKDIGTRAASLDVMDASYLIGVVYITMMPGNVRADYGAYYTPPALCEHLLDLAADAGVDWGSARILDPACGGGAFLSPVARRMVNSLGNCSPRIALKHITQRLRGFELDPFAAWLSQVFLEDTLSDLCRAAGSRLPSVVDVCDSLEQDATTGQEYDLVVGNPPYGRVTLPQHLRDKYKRSLYGHANLYGAFTDMALRFAKPGGVIAYVTPTSFLAGKYYKALRTLLSREAPPVSIGFVSDRRGVFSDVLQETLLATYQRDGNPGVTRVHFIAPSNGGIVSTSAGSFRLPQEPGQPWLIPRNKGQSKLVQGAESMPCRLADYGYKVSTGPLVWNRHKASLRDKPGKDTYPLIWAESVQPHGKFRFRAEKRNHKPYFRPLRDEQWVVTSYPCVLVQRTTAKEQPRRLIAAALPQSFIRKHRAVVVENHLNMIRPIDRAPKITPRTLAALLNSETIDQLFRCINGSVAVSAYELEALPLPAPDDMEKISRLVKAKASREKINTAIKRIYNKGAC